MWELLGSVRLCGHRCSSVTSQALRPLMLSRSPAMLGMVVVPSLHVHVSSRLGGARSLLPERVLLQDGITPPAINLNCTLRLSTLPSR
jgi:hypothetical protein